MNRRYCVFPLLVVLLTGMAAASRVDPLTLARQFGPQTAARGELPVQGLGLLIADFHLDSDWEAGSDYVAELGPSTGGDVLRFPMKVGQPGVLPLAAGRYCLSALIRGGKRIENRCEAPFYDVSADSVDITGRVEVAVKRKRCEVTDRVIDAAYAAPVLSDAQQQEVATFLAEAGKRGAQTFFFSSPPGLRMTARLYPGGVAETQEYTLANASYRRGTWSRDGDAYALQFSNGHALYRVAPAAAGWRGVMTTLTDRKAGGVDFRADRQLAVATDLRCWQWSTCGERWTSGILAHPDYTFVKGRQDLSGVVEFEFALGEEKGAVKPLAIAVVRTAFSPELTASVQESFGFAVYSPDLAAASAQRYRQAIEFRREGEALTATPGPLNRVP